MSLRGSGRGAALAAALVLAASSATATAATPRCGTTPGLVCTTVTVPLDRSGVVPGTVALHVEELPATAPAGAVFLIAGGPGQGSAHTFDLGSPEVAALFRYLFPGYTLVAYDDRGTGQSGLLDCPALQTSTTARGQDALASSCAASLGVQASFYGTADHVADLDAVRAALGFDKIALYGVSYGTKLALAYAAAYPDHVARMVLDSVLPPDLPDPFSSNVLRAMPATLQAWCAHACAAATPDYAGDVIAVANRLAAAPVRGTVLQANGTRKSVRLDGVDFLSMVIDADLDPGLAAELPAAVRAERLGDGAPLLRLAALDAVANRYSAPDLSLALFAATSCRDGPFPWPADSAPATRAALLRQAIASLPPGTFGPFGSWASTVGNADLCVDWPAPSGGAALTGPLPNVPVLALSGGFDLRTPTAGAQAVVSAFPQGQLLVVPGVGHSVVSSDVSFCAAQAVHDWMRGAARVGPCPRVPYVVPPLAAFPRATSRRNDPLATYALAAKTVREAEAAWVLTNGRSAAAGLAGGRLVPDGSDAFRLVGYALAPGVVLGGLLQVEQGESSTLQFRGSLTVAGSSAAAGTLLVSGSRLTGRFGGRTVGS